MVCGSFTILCTWLTYPVLPRIPFPVYFRLGLATEVCMSLVRQVTPCPGLVLAVAMGGSMWHHMHIPWVWWTATGPRASPAPQLPGTLACCCAKPRAGVTLASSGHLQREDAGSEERPAGEMGVGSTVLLAGFSCPGSPRCTSSFLPSHLPGDFRPRKNS